MATSLEAKAAQHASGSADTLVERAVALIYQDILTGVLPPDTKLGLHKLTKLYQIGPTPIREALSRLCSLGFVQASPNRGFRVRPVNREDLRDIIDTRLLVELEALRRSIARGDEEWEVAILATLHRYKKFLERFSEGVWRGDFGYDRAHKQFHMALLSACGSPRLIGMCETLYDASFRYRCVTVGSVTHRRTADLEEAHAKLAGFVVRREVDAACNELARQIQITFVVTYPESPAKSPKPPSAKPKKQPTSSRG